MIFNISIVDFHLGNICLCVCFKTNQNLPAPATQVIKLKQSRLAAPWQSITERKRQEEEKEKERSHIHRNSLCAPRCLAGNRGTHKSMCSPVTALQLNQCQWKSELLLTLIHRTGTCALRRPIASTQEGQDVCLLTITVNTVGGLMENNIDWTLTWLVETFSVASIQCFIVLEYIGK